MSSAIELQGTGKRYSQLQDRGMLLRSLLPTRKPERRDLWALRHVDVRIEEGETVGVIGRNGAGKTTLLRLLAGVTRPSEGRVLLRGRVAPLIGVGVGFHPEMSGRENVYVNGMLLGLTKAQVDQRFESIVDFAELEGFIDTPVKFYSSGMFMRLGFAIAIHVEPRILLVDEVLAVGDVAFQLKCFDRMRALQADGTTIVLVSHSMHAIRLLCPRALLFRKGALELDGDTETVIAKHHELLTVDEDEGGVGAGATVLRHQLLDEDGAPVHAARQDQSLTYRLDLRFEEAVDSPQLFFFVVAEDGTLAYEMKTAIGRTHRTFAAGEEAHAEIRFDARLGGGSYRLLTAITDRDGRHSLHRDLGGLLLYLAPPLGSAGIADLAATIAIDGDRLSDHDDLRLFSPDSSDQNLK